MSTRTKIFILAVLVSFGIASRFLPHAWNFAPVTAITLFISAYLGMRYSVVALLFVSFMTDLFLGFYHWPIMCAVYLSLISAVFWGGLMKTKKTPSRFFISVVGASLVFFFVTNWAVWQFGTMYAHSMSGLIQSYVMALPFFRSSLLSDVFYSSVLFGAFELFLALRRRQVSSPGFSSSGIAQSQIQL